MRTRVLAYRIAGYACLGISVACIPVGTSPGAVAQCYAVVRDAVHTVVAAVGAPAASPSPRPRKRRSFLGSGPIVVRANGGIDLGTRRQSQNAVAHATSTTGVTMELGIERRTERTSLTVRQPISYSSGVTAVTQSDIAYQTPRYGLDYGPLSGGSEIGQLQLGAFTRGLRASFPRNGHTLELLTAAAFSGDGTGYRVGGLRYTLFGRKTTLSLTALRATNQAGGRDTVLGAALRRNLNSGSALLEAGLSSTAGVPGTTDGRRLAIGLTADRAGARSYGELRAAYQPNGFAGLNAVTLGQRAVNFTGRTLIGPASLAVSTGFSNGPDGASNRRLSLQTSLAGHRFSFSGQGSIATSMSSNGATLVRGFGSSLSTTVHGFALQGIASVSATDSGGAGNEVDRAYSFNASRAFGPAYLQYSHGIGTTSSASGPSSFSEDDLAYVRPIGRKLDLSLAAVRTRQNAATGRTVTTTGSVGLVRRLSPSVSLRAAYNYDIATGASASHGNSLSVDLVGPLALGADRITGRAVPGAPAVVRGRVYVAAGTDVPGASQQRGIGDILMVLDGVRVQRTDATGAYEFRPVAAGTHQVTIEPASLSPGLSADRLGDAFTIGGGQSRTVDFGIGRFAGVSGEVRIRRGAGYEPIPDVGVVVDDLYRVKTGFDGRFSVGRLTPGVHRVAIGSETLRSDIAFDGPTLRSVTVPAGTYVPVVFTALPLGSIGGRVSVVDESGQPHTAENIYVVADPGDHAAITDADGSFVIDNLQAGSYSLHLDDNTTPEGFALAAPLAVTLGPSQRITDALLELTAEQKSVVMTFDAGKRSPVVVMLDPPRAPPGGATRIRVRTSIKGVRGMSVAGAALGELQLRGDGNGLWSGIVSIPITAPPGEIVLRADTVGAKGNGDAIFVVDPHVPLVAVRLFPAHPKPGTLVRALIRVGAPTAERDELVTADGQRIHARSFQLGVATFDVRVPGRGLPLDARIVTSDGRSYAFALR